MTDQEDAEEREYRIKKLIEKHHKLLLKLRDYLWDLRQSIKRHEWEEAMKTVEEMEKELPKTQIGYQCPQDDCKGAVVPIRVGFTWRWTCRICHRDYGYGTDSPTFNPNHKKLTGEEAEMFLRNCAIILSE
jgi:hypothetical protein